MKCQSPFPLPEQSSDRGEEWVKQITGRRQVPKVKVSNPFTSAQAQPTTSPYGKIGVDLGHEGGWRRRKCPTGAHSQGRSVRCDWLHPPSGAGEPDQPKAVGSISVRS